MLYDPAGQPLTNLKGGRARALGHNRCEVTVSGAILDCIVIRIDHHDTALLCADGIIEQSQSAVKGAVQVKGGRSLGQDTQQCFRIALFTRQFGSAVNNALFKFIGQAAGLGKKPSILDGHSRLVGQRTEDLLLVFGIDIWLITLRRKHTNDLATHHYGYCNNRAGLSLSKGSFAQVFCLLIIRN